MLKAVKSGGGSGWGKGSLGFSAWWVTRFVVENGWMDGWKAYGEGIKASLDKMK